MHGPSLLLRERAVLRPDLHGRAGDVPGSVRPAAIRAEQGGVVAHLVCAGLRDVAAKNPRLHPSVVLLHSLRPMPVLAGFHPRAVLRCERQVRLRHQPFPSFDVCLDPSPAVSRPTPRNSDPNCYNAMPCYHSCGAKRLPGFYPGHQWGTLSVSAPEAQVMRRDDGGDGGGDGGVIILYDSPGVYYGGDGDDGGGWISSGDGGGGGGGDYGDAGGGGVAGGDGGGDGGGGDGGGGDGGGGATFIGPVFIALCNVLHLTLLIPPLRRRWWRG